MGQQDFMVGYWLRRAMAPWPRRISLFFLAGIFPIAWVFSTTGREQPVGNWFNQVAYPPGTTLQLIYNILLLLGGILFLLLLDRLLSRWSDRFGEASLAKECRSIRHLAIGYPAGMTNFEVLREQKFLEVRLQPLGVGIEWIPFPSASTLLAALSNGVIDFCGGGGTASIFSQAAQHVFVRVAKEKYPDLESQTIVVPDGSAIASVADLRGKRVAFDEGSSAHYVLIRALKFAGLSYGDIDPIYLPQDEALPQFIDGKLDAWVIWMPYAPTDERRRYPGRSLGSLKDLLGAKASAELHTLYYSTPELLRDYPRLLKAILEEVNEAGCWVGQRLLEEQSVTSSAISSSVEELQRRSLERAILPLDAPTLESLQGQVNILHSLHLIPQRVNVRDGAYSIELRQNWTC